MLNFERIKPRWSGLVIVAGTGPSLTEDVVALCQNRRVIAVNDAYRLIPWAEVLYACDARWWEVHKGCPGFNGEKWTSSHESRHKQIAKVANEFGLRVVLGAKHDGFSSSPKMIHYGRNSGFQAVNLAILWGANPIILVGFDYRMCAKRHFFGKHPSPLSNGGNYPQWVEMMRVAQRTMPSDLSIVNCTPDSAIDCFPRHDLNEVLNGAALSNAA